VKKESPRNNKAALLDMKHRLLYSLLHHNPKKKNSFSALSEEKELSNKSEHTIATSGLISWLRDDCP